MNYGKCCMCGEALTHDERALNLKAVSQDASEHYCLDCLAKKHRSTRENLERAIENFKKQGCALFI